MLEILFYSATFFQKLINILSDINNQITFCITKEGLYIKVKKIDNKEFHLAHCSLIEVNLKPSQQLIFNCPQQVKISLNIQNLCQTLKKQIKKEDSLKLELIQENQMEQIKITIFNQTKNQQFIVPLINCDEIKFELPPDDYDYQVELSSSYFFTLLQSMKKVHTITLETQENITISIQDSVSIIPSTIIKTNENIGKITQLLSINLLMQISKAQKLQDKMKFFISKDLPLLIQFELEENSLIKFYVAPKIQDDD